MPITRRTGCYDEYELLAKGFRMNEMSQPPIRFLLFDTCAVLKIFFKEKGSDVVQWLLSEEAFRDFSVHCVTSKHVQDEVGRVLRKQVDMGVLIDRDAQTIIDRAVGYFSGSGGMGIVDLDSIPEFTTGYDTSAEELIRKHRLKHCDRTDCAILSSIVNYLQCLKGGSLPHVVTADKRFSKVIIREGYRVINPNKMSIQDVKAYYQSLGKYEI